MENPQKRISLFLTLNMGSNHCWFCFVVGFVAKKDNGQTQLLSAHTPLWLYHNSHLIHSVSLCWINRDKIHSIFFNDRLNFQSSIPTGMSLISEYQLCSLNTEPAWQTLMTVTLCEAAVQLQLSAALCCVKQAF